MLILTYPDSRTIKHMVFVYRKSLGEDVEQTDTDEEKLDKIALLLGVEKVLQKDIDQFMKNIKNVKPRKSEGYGFGKLSGYVHDNWFQVNRYAYA